MLPLADLIPRHSVRQRANLDVVANLTISFEQHGCVVRPCDSSSRVFLPSRRFANDTASLTLPRKGGPFILHVEPSGERSKSCLMDLDCGYKHGSLSAYSMTILNSIFLLICAVYSKTERLYSKTDF